MTMILNLNMDVNASQVLNQLAIHPTYDYEYVIIVCISQAKGLMCTDRDYVYDLII